MRYLKRVFLGLALFVLALGAFVWTMFRTIPNCNTPQQKFDVIVVLGVPAMPDGGPSREAYARVLEGVNQWRAGVAPRIIMSGGAAHNKWIEAHTMSQVAQQLGVPQNAIIEEGRSLNTIGNIHYSVLIMQANGWNSMEVVSSWAHVQRAALILQHFPVAWKIHGAPWSPYYSLHIRLLADWYEAVYCTKLRLRGFQPSPFIKRWR